MIQLRNYKYDNLYYIYSEIDPMEILKEFR